MRLVPLPSLALLALAGCGPADADTADTDTADTEPAPDTDTGPEITWPESTLAGAVTVRTTYDGVTVCDLEAVLTGLPYVGPCPGCDFAVAVTAEVTRDDSTAECSPDHAPLSFVAGGAWTDLVMAHADAHLHDGGYYVDDVFLSRFDYDGAAATYLAAYTYDGAARGPATYTLSDTEVAWTVAVAAADTFRYAYTDCGTATASYATEASGGAAYASSVACDATTSDRWTFVATDTTATVSVDTTSAATTFDPELWVSGPDGCVLVTADDNFTCAYPPPAFMCPAAELTGLVPGATYGVVVRSRDGGRCLDPVGEYALAVAGGSEVTLAEDDARSGAPYTVDIVGTGTIAAAR